VYLVRQGSANQQSPSEQSQRGVEWNAELGMAVIPKVVRVWLLIEHFWDSVRVRMGLVILTSACHWLLLG